MEHARNLVGIADAVHGEYGSAGSEVITPLACSLADNEITVQLAPDSILAGLHGMATVTERTTCNYGLNPKLQHLADERGLRIVATDDTGEARAVERIDHPFFLATLYQPQLRSTPESPHPIFVGLLEAARTA